RSQDAAVASRPAAFAYQAGPRSLQGAPGPPGMIKALLAEKRKAVTRPDGTVKPGLGKNTVRLIRATLSVMLADAVDDGLVRTNPARDVGGHRKRADTISVAERQKKIRPLSREQLATLLGVTLDRVTQVEGMRAHEDSSDEHQNAVRAARRDAALFLTLADTGVRPGEVLALRWDDFDSATRAMRIERAISLRAVSRRRQKSLAPWISRSV